MANLFKRINDVITANISDLIDKVEEPDKMIKQIIREMEENISRAKDGVVEAIASEKTLAQNVERHRSQAKSWQDKARMALKDGNEELARQALTQKTEQENILLSLEPALESAVNTSAGLKAQLRALEAKLNEAKSKRAALAARQHAAEAQQDMTKMGATFKKGVAAHDQFGRMEERVADIEARTAAVAEVYEGDGLEETFGDMATRQSVDADLAALKQELADEQG